MNYRGPQISHPQDTRVGTTFGHEFIGVIEEIGSDVQQIKVGNRVLVPFNISCNESHAMATVVCGIYGYAHTAGGFQGGQAEYVRVPYADVSPTVIPEGMDLENALMLTDVLPAGYQARRYYRNADQAATPIYLI